MKNKVPYARCDECPYIDQPFVPSVGPKKTERALIGIAPHNDEVRTGEPFVGPSGRLLNAMLQHCHLPRESVKICNVCCCKPTRGTVPEDEAIAACMPRLKREIAQAGVKYALAMGRVPMSVVLPESQHGKVSDYTGVWNPSPVLEGVEVLSSYHPAHILRGNQDAFTDLLQAAEKFVRPPHRIPDTQYVVLKTHDDVRRLVKALLATNEPLCLDLETTHINMKESRPDEWWHGYILCAGFCLTPGKAIVIPEKLWNSKTTLKLLLPALERPGGWFGHNLGFDVLMLSAYYDKIFDHDIQMIVADDTMYMHYAWDERRGTHGLKLLSGIYFERPNYDETIYSYLKNPRKDSYAIAPREVLYKYVAMDVDITHRLKAELEKQLQTGDPEPADLWMRPYRAMLQPVIPTLIRTEQRGVTLDLERLAEVRQYMADRVQGYRETLQDLCGDSEFNPNAPHQVGRVLYQEKGYKTPKGRRIKRGSTNKGALTKLKAQYPDDEFVATMLLYRRWNKMLTTYANKLHLYVDPHNRAHFRYNLAGTVTGRIEAGLLLTIPRAYTPEGKMLRTLFRAREGYKLLGADYSQSELRWVGWYSQEPYLYTVYEEERDLHTEVAVAMYGENFSKEERNWTKMFNFSWAYGGTEYSFADDAGLPIEEARKWVRRYSRLMPIADQYKKDCINTVKTRGWLRTVLGRKRRWSLVTTSNLHDMEKSAVNFQPSSTSSDATLMPFHLAAEHFRKHSMDIHPWLFLHDGVYFEVRDDPTLIREAAEIVQTKMLDFTYYLQENADSWYSEFEGYRRMPYKVDCDLGDNWGEMNGYEL